MEEVNNERGNEAQRNPNSNNEIDLLDGGRLLFALGEVDFSQQQEKWMVCRLLLITMVMH
jgi:hypothetical protein